MEVAVLKRLQNSSIHVCKFIGCGRNNKVNYVVMSLLGPNLSELRKHQPNQKFSISTTLRVGVQIIAAIQSMHDCGFLHRDIKPSNFAIGDTPETARTCYMLDYGLSRQYTTVTGEVRQPRPVAGFRGTVRYASLNAHLSRDLGRHDDLWSVFYLLIELAIGHLPWRRIRDKEEAGEYKGKYDHKKLIRGLPIEFSYILDELKSSSYFDKPDYALITGALKDAISRLGIQGSDPFDWEQDFSAPSMTTASIVSPPAVKLNEDEGREEVDKKLPAREPSKTNCSDVEELSENENIANDALEDEKKKYLKASPHPLVKSTHPPSWTHKNEDNQEPHKEVLTAKGIGELHLKQSKESVAPSKKISILGQELPENLEIVNKYVSEGEEEFDDAVAKEQINLLEPASNSGKENSAGFDPAGFDPKNRLKVNEVDGRVGGGVAPAKSYHTESLNRFYDLNSHHAAKESQGSTSRKSSEREHQESLNVTSKYFSKRENTKSQKSNDAALIYPNDKNEDLLRDFAMAIDESSQFLRKVSKQPKTCFTNEPSHDDGASSESSQSLQSHDEKSEDSKRSYNLKHIDNRPLRTILVHQLVVDSSSSESDSKKSIEMLFALKTQNVSSRTNVSSNDRRSRSNSTPEGTTKAKSVEDIAVSKSSTSKKLATKSEDDIASKSIARNLQAVAINSQIPPPTIQVSVSEHTGKKQLTKQQQLRSQVIEECSSSSGGERQTRSETNCLEVLPSPMKILPRPPPNPPPLNYSRSLLARRRRFVRSTKGNHSKS